MATPEHGVDQSAKLETIFERMHLADQETAYRSHAEALFHRERNERDRSHSLGYTLPDQPC